MSRRAVSLICPFVGPGFNIEYGNSTEEKKHGVELFVSTVVLSAAACTDRGNSK